MMTMRALLPPETSMNLRRMLAAPSLSSAPPIGTMKPRFVSPSIFAGLIVLRSASNVPVTTGSPSRTRNRPRAITSRMRWLSSSTTRSASAPTSIRPFCGQAEQRRDVAREDRAGPSSSGRPRARSSSSVSASGGGATDVHRRDATVGVERGQAPAAVGAAGEAIARERRMREAASRWRRAPRTRPRRPRRGTRSRRSVHAARRERERLVEQARLRLTWVGWKTRAGSSVVVERATHELEAARAVAEVEVQDAGLAAHHARRRGSRRRGAASSSKRGLRRAMIADRDLADADDRIDEHDVASGPSPVSVIGGTS